MAIKLVVAVTDTGWFSLLRQQTLLKAPSNGILLRRDIHSVFDAGYVTVSPDLRFEVSNRFARSSRTGGTTMRCMGKR